MTRPTLDAVEARVAGALAEKAMTTPDQYPLTLASLVAACNQKTSREPVTSLSDHDVRAALERLGRRGLVGTTAGAGHRVAKFRHLLDRALDLSKGELTALTLLLLRGPQTPGEIRTRSARMADFPTVEAAEEALWLLGDRDEPLVVQLPRAAGQSADRYAHRLSGEPAPPPEATGEPEARGEPEAPGEGGAGRAASEAEERPAPAPAAGARSDAAPLDVRVAALEAEVARLAAALDAFRSQFE